MLNSAINDAIVKALQGLICQVLTFNKPLDVVLSQFFAQNRSLSSQMRHLIAETIYVLLRHYYKIMAIINDDASVNAATTTTTATLAPKPTLAALESNIAIKHAISATTAKAIIAIIWLQFLKLDARQIAQKTKLNVTKYAVNLTITSDCELPEWLTTQLAKSYSNDTITALDLAMQSSAPLDLRVNILKANVQDVLTLLHQDGIAANLTPFSPYAIRLPEKIPLQRYSLYLQGKIEVQDEGSQIAGLLLKPKRGEMIVDFCAGSGGKALLFGMLMHNTGRIYAFDIASHRLDKLNKRLARSGLSNIYPQLITHENDSKVKRLIGKIDKVFVDAPCSGIGTLRRNPDLKFRQNLTTITELAQKQLQILQAASRLVKAGGVLVYVTCSLLAVENQEVVSAFLKSNCEFQLMPVAAALSSSAIHNVPTLTSCDSTHLILLPNQHNTDGFFAAIFSRKM